jgi:predicted DCC family thiol-disulfide oxidoreductase YuxK
MQSLNPSADAPPARAVIVYDGACPFCRRQIAWIRERDRDEAFEYVPRQAADLLARFPVLAAGDFNTGMRLVSADGRVLVGADAVYAVARRLRGWRWVALLYRVPGLHRLAQWIYAWIAKNRQRLAADCEEGCPR